MPNWQKVIKEMAKAVREVAVEGATRRAPHRLGSKRFECLFWSCDERIRVDHVMCYDHWNGVPGRARG